jgi:hypothetical protein
MSTGPPTSWARRTSTKQCSRRCACGSSDRHCGRTATRLRATQVARPCHCPRRRACIR